MSISTNAHLVFRQNQGIMREYTRFVCTMRNKTVLTSFLRTIGLLVANVNTSCDDDQISEVVQSRRGFLHRYVGESPSLDSLYLSPPLHLDSFSETQITGKSENSLGRICTCLSPANDYEADFEMTRTSG